MVGSIIEGTKECLERLQMDYVDVIFAHRPDNTGVLPPVTHICENLFGLNSSFLYSSDGGGCPRVQLCH